MPSNIPFQLVYIFTFILLLPSQTSTARIAKPGCQDHCGDLKIPYPFGVGPSCSFDSSFDITCNGSALSPKAYLSVIDKQVIEINDTYIRVKYPNLVSVCYEMSDETGMNASYMQSMSMNLSGTPYTLSNYNVLTTMGCDDMAMQSNGSWVSGGCLAFCTDINDTSRVGYCAKNDSSLNNGCCVADLYGDGVRDYVAAEVMDMSGNFQRKKLFPCSYALIQEKGPSDNFIFSYPLYYLNSSTAFLNDNWASTTNPPVVRLGWSLGSQNCSQVKLSACQEKKSVCVDINDKLKGYLCRCIPGYEGNPYLLGGCQAISFSSSVAKSGCPEQCGELSIAFPFGVGPSCYREPSFEIICDASTYPPVAYLANLKAKIIEFTNSSEVLVNYPNLTGLACYNLLDYQHGMTKIMERSLIIDLSRTQYTFSDDNWITAVGCDDMVVGTVRQESRSFMSTSCASVCWEGETDPSSGISCTQGSGNIYKPGYGCCSVVIPKGTSFLQANLSDLSGQQNHRKFFSCSYVSVNYYKRKKNAYSSYGFSLNRLNYSYAMEVDDSYGELMLDWRIGHGNCEEARKNETNFACQNNSDCVDLDTKVGGYLCNCKNGYQGNPYVTSGCQDIDECANATTNPCDSLSSCVNTQGSVNCLCPKGYYGDGRKDSMRCIQKPQTKTNMIIFIGIGSGLGFLLFLLLVFWLYNVLQKRKDKLLKEEFFRRNGGLLLQQQINEGALGRTKLFPVEELEAATDNFNENRILGQGGQGTVYKGMLSNGKIVAIKKSKLVKENQLEQFINEVVILSQINHRNVVKLLGCCLETEIPLLVYEFMPNGTLFDLIHDPNNEFPFTWNMRVKSAADIAGALAYLHSASSIPIYHRDIKSSNILLDEKYVVKVSDFGTSRSIAVDQTHLTTMVKGTFGYLDPEYFQSSQFTEKSDVYSFGVVLAELLTGRRPISSNKGEEERGLATRFLACMEEHDLDSILDPQVLEQGKKEEVILVARIAQKCLNLKGKMRPSMKEVATELESLSKIPANAKYEFKEVRNFEDQPTKTFGIEYTWSTSCNNAAASSSDTHPLMSKTL